MRLQIGVDGVKVGKLIFGIVVDVLSHIRVQHLERGRVNPHGDNDYRSALGVDELGTVQEMVAEQAVDGVHRHGGDPKAEAAGAP